MIETIVLSALIVLLVLALTRNAKDERLLPGPAGWPLIGNILDLKRAGPNIEEYMLQLATVHGRVFTLRLGSKQMIVLNDLELFKEIFYNKAIQGKPNMPVTAKVFGQDGAILTSKGKEGSNNKHFASRFYHQLFQESRAMNVVLPEIQRILNQFKNFSSPELSENIHSLFVKASCNILSSFSYGRQVEYDDKELCEMQLIVSNCVRHLAGTLGANYTSLIRTYFPYSKSYDLNRNLIRIKEILSTNVKKEKAKNKAGNNLTFQNCEHFVDAFLYASQHEKPDMQFTDEKLLWYLWDFLFGGGGTLPVFLTWALFLVMSRPDVQKKCQNELDLVIGRGRDPDISDQQSLHYINATIEEIKRIACVLPLGTPHIAKETTKIEGFIISKDAIVYPNYYAVYRDKELWKQPYKFLPERHLNDSGNFVPSDKIVAFLAGERACLGEQLTRLTSFLVISTLLHRFKFMAVSEDTVDICKGVTVLTRAPLPFKMHIVERATSD